MKRYNEAQELAPRDVVARAILSEMHRTNNEHVYLDMTAKPEGFVEKRFPRIYATCMSYGVDLARDVAPVCPAAHYMMGGVKTDLWGRTSLPGLYAAGETADTGVHGANRLASNSLLEGLVFGARSGQAMMKDAPVKKKHAAGLPGSIAPKPGNSAEARPHNSAKHPQTAALTKIRDIMWRLVGILRSGKELAGAIEQLQSLELPKTEQPGRFECELRNMHALAMVIAKSALARHESRGSHYRSDFPYRDDDDFAKHSIAQKGKEIRFEV
jgi:L-aspartate oxidase